jgi:hypothetical protein
MKRQAGRIQRVSTLTALDAFILCVRTVSEAIAQLGEVDTLVHTVTFVLVGRTLEAGRSTCHNIVTYSSSPNTLHITRPHS